MTAIDHQRRRRVEAVFYEVLDTPEADRHAAIERACGSDELLLADVRMLFGASAAEIQAFMQQPAADLVGLGAVPELVAPAEIGGYEIVGIIGEGGMGVVYEAVQHKPKRTVALKVIRPGMTTPSLLRRFEQETQVLGRLQHLGIAQIYEAGTADTPQGMQPYFAMEFVRGRTLREHVTAAKPTTRERLELVTKICDAVHHAHLKGVIHRDLKPGNILVDATNQPKILDFGVACVTDSDIQATTVATHMGQLIGTLPYMSPEQFAADPRELDTRSDVYALGVIMYEMLAGHPPFNLNNLMIHEAIRVVREEDPTPLSSVNRLFRGDIETLVGKALDKDRDRRYSSAAELASDIRRYLANEPIVARAPSALYQLRKFARRNRAVVFAATVAAMALTCGAGVATWQAITATHARDDAKREARKAKLANDFMIGMLASASPDASPGGLVSVAALLDAASRQLKAGNDAMPSDFQAILQTTLGRAYHAAGRYDEAALALERAVDLARNGGSATPADLVAALNELCELRRIRGEFDQAEECLEEAATARREAGLDSPPVDLGIAMLRFSNGRFDDAERLFRKAVDAAKSHPAIDDQWRAEATTGLSMTLERLDKLEEAVVVGNEALAIRERIHGECHTTVAESLTLVANALEAGGSYIEAEKAHRRALAIREKLLEPRHPDLAFTLNNLGLVLRRLDRLDDAEVMLRRALAIRQAKLPDPHQSLASTLNNLAFVLEGKGEMDAAERYYAQAVDMAKRALSDDHLMTNVLRSSHANVLAKLGRFAEAEPMLNACYANLENKLGQDHRRTRTVATYLANLYIAWERPADAEPWTELATADSD